MKILLFLLLLPYSLFAEPIQRQVIAFWDSQVDKIPDDSIIHRTLEMPLNYLGMDVVYYDINKSLPVLSKNDGVRGILVSFQVATKMKEPEQFIEWASDAIELGKKVVLIQNVGFLENSKGDFTEGDVQNKLYEKLGFTNSEQWIDYPFDYRVISKDNELIPFEKHYPERLPGFYLTHVISGKAKSYLKVGIPGKPESEADLVILSPHGGYIAIDFGNNFDPLVFASSPRSLGWYVNPFRFFELAFGLTDLPVPDTTTLAGRRIFIATLHGDDWNGNTILEEYKGKDTYNSEVLLEKVIKPNPDIPIAVGFVAADFDPKWASKSRSQKTLRDYLSLNQVEASSHTYSHPFYWDFFRTGGPEKEIDYLHLYPYGSWQNSFLSWFRSKWKQTFHSAEFTKDRLKWGYAKPRAYANEPFNLEKEISGALNYLNEFAPANNKVKLLLWSGDSRPWDVPVQLTQEAGMKNFGGGFVRLDSEYPSVLFIYPTARKPGGIIQLYATSNADNGYTYGWKDQFYGYEFLPETLKNTDSPRRLKPINLYYHSYSGEFASSVNAILSNIAFIRTQNPIAMRVARYIDIGLGFYSVQIDQLSNNSWKIRDRKGLGTIRFDTPRNRVVDFENSKGVIGYREHQGSLYVYLDAAVEEPILTLKESNTEIVPYLIDSNWEVWELNRNANVLNYKTKGWGNLSMQWKMPKKGTYQVSVPSQPVKNFTTSDESILTVALELPYNVQTEMSIKQQ